jgi:hypothetical protein
VSDDVVAEAFPCGPDLDRHLRKIQKVADAGVDERGLKVLPTLGPSPDRSLDRVTVRTLIEDSAGPCVEVLTGIDREPALDPLFVLAALHLLPVPVLGPMSQRQSRSKTRTQLT